jgi:hypothetical protein
MTDYPPNQESPGNRHRGFSVDRTMKHEQHPCSQRQSPVTVPERWRWHQYEAVAPRA